MSESEADADMTLLPATPGIFDTPTAKKPAACAATAKKMSPLVEDDEMFLSGEQSSEKILISVKEYERLKKIASAVSQVKDLL